MTGIKLVLMLFGLEPFTEEHASVNQEDYGRELQDAKNNQSDQVDFETETGGCK